MKHDRNLGIVMHGWDSISQVWLHRSIECLEDRVAFVASFRAGEQWNDSISGFNLSEPKSSLRERIRHKLQGPPDNDRRFEQYIKKSGIKTLLIHFAEMAVRTQAAWQALDIEVFVYCHGYDVHFDARHDHWPYAQRHANDYAKRVFQLSERVTFLANSQHTQQKLLAIGIPKEKIHIVYYGVEVPSLAQCTKSSLPDNRPLNLLFLGRLVDFKGPDKVIKLFDIACQQGLNAHLTIAGDGNLMPACQLLARDSEYCDRITFTGPVSRERASQLFAEADIFINHQCLGLFSKREEAFGVTMIEAMSYGLPILTTKSGGIPESIISGKTGYLVEPGNMEDAVEQLLDLAASSQTRQIFGRNGRLHIEKNFSLEKQKSRLNTILNETLS